LVVNYWQIEGLVVVAEIVSPVAVIYTGVEVAPAESPRIKHPTPIPLEVSPTWTVELASEMTVFPAIDISLDKVVAPVAANVLEKAPVVKEAPPVPLILSVPSTVIPSLNSMTLL